MFARFDLNLTLERCEKFRQLVMFIVYYLLRDEMIDVELAKLEWFSKEVESFFPY